MGHGVNIRRMILAAPNRPRHSAFVSLQSELHWPVFGEALSLLGFMGLFITAGGFVLIHRGEQVLAEQNG